MTVAAEAGVGEVILAAPTPPEWVEAAVRYWPQLLLDHANCEKKAASTALALMFAYPEEEAMCLALSRLAREELRHFEQVTRLMRRLNVPFRRLKPGRYAAALRAALATSEPQRRQDLMLLGALIEARSCERFRLLAPRLPEPVGSFYADLARSEARHHELYLGLAQTSPASATAGSWQQRLVELAAIEAEQITRPDTELRFHSGPLQGLQLETAVAVPA